jgi:hypothetical protein
LVHDLLLSFEAEQRVPAKTVAEKFKAERLAPV